MFTDREPGKEAEGQEDGGVAAGGGEPESGPAGGGGYSRGAEARFHELASRNRDLDAALRQSQERLARLEGRLEATVGRPQEPEFDTEEQEALYRMQQSQARLDAQNRQLQQQVQELQANEAAKRAARARKDAISRIVGETPDLGADAKDLLQEHLELVHASGRQTAEDLRAAAAKFRRLAGMTGGTTQAKPDLRGATDPRRADPAGYAAGKAAAAAQTRSPATSGGGGVATAAPAPGASREEMRERARAAMLSAMSANDG